MCFKKTPRILSIQSHVVSGYVGNKSAVFPLQLLGFEVDAINSVQLSNHTGYKVFKGQVLNDKDLEELINGLVQNNLDNYTHLLTGYVGSASFLKKIAEVVRVLKHKNPNLIYVCDPVMGDNGKMYVPEALKEIYREEIVPLADIVVPNQFELELLSNIKINTMSELQDAVTVLHKIGPQTVAVSSTEINDKLTAIISTNKENKLIKINIPKIPASFTGSGDLFAALFLAHTYLQNDMKTAIEKTVNSLYSVLLKTYEYSKACQDKESQLARKIELKLIQSKNYIETPEICLFAEVIVLTN
ncbi:pyridoxal kinase isoform X2 [Bombus vancouverensis nearcticus]|uniref:Pyridoxal kinase n=1 Tax=Bombus bifarius TaxID=103933 RepID=A0A6P8MX63_9HYME|nr:pyridoxal kinase [Bombus vancouverensis nearcticus]XP_033307307.1 pyridoxal kinase [Bombus bifarius]